MISSFDPHLAASLLVCLGALSVPSLAVAAAGGQAAVKRITPILVVEQIEPVLEFWERLGFERTAEVPEGDRLVFVILTKDGQEVMYQTLASIESDVEAVADKVRGSRGVLFIEVSDLDATIAALGDAPVVVPVRTTFYGATEIFVEDPAGNIVGFAFFDGS